MAKRYYRLVGAVRLPSDDTKLWVRVGAGSFEEVTVAGGVYYAGGLSRSDDLIEAVEQAISSASAVTRSFSLALNRKTGIFQLSNFLGSDLRIQCVSPVDGQESVGGRIIFDYLKIAGGDFRTFATGQVHQSSQLLCHEGGFYPKLYMTEDKPEFDNRTRQAIPDNGPVQTITFGYVRYQRIGVRLQDAYNRRDANTGDGDDEWRQFQTFMERHSKGVPFRLYPDRDNDLASATPFAERSNPLGFQTLVLDIESTNWSPDYPFNPNYAIADIPLRAVVYTPRS